MVGRLTAELVSGAQRPARRSTPLGGKTPCDQGGSLERSPPIQFLMDSSRGMGFLKTACSKMCPSFAETVILVLVDFASPDMMGRGGDISVSG